MEDSPMKFSRFSRIHFMLIPAVVFIFAVGTTFGASEGGSGGVTVIPDWSVLIQIANFIFLIWVLNLILYRPIRNVLIQRREKIAGLEESIGSSARDLQEKEDAFAAGIKDARTRGRLEKDALLTAAEDEEKKVIAKINEKAQADLAEVRDTLAKDAEEVRKILLQEIDDHAESICRKILGRTVS
jgi:F-type H+-transporting ATPase subunit b